MKKDYKNRARKKTLSPSREKKQSKPWFLQRIINEWFNRLLGAASDKSFSSQDAMYAANRTSRDYVWNTIGGVTWGLTFPLLTMVVTQLVGVEQAGMFSMAFVVGLLLMFAANYGIRTFQVSDLNEAYSFSDYQINRIITCVVALILGILYCFVRGYTEEMFIISMAVYAHKIVDGLADAYEGRLQQVGKLYLAGVSQSIRSVFSFTIFSLVLLITRNLPASCIAMAVVAILCFVIISLPLAYLETPKSKRPVFENIKALLSQCFPLFIALFMFNLIDSMPKFVMEGVLSYDNQLYFNAMYFPAQAILLFSQFVYRPQFLRMANLWAEKSDRKKFDLLIIVILLMIAVLTVFSIFVMDWIGVPLLGFFYGIDFEKFRGLITVMLVAGGVTAGIDFLYQVITVLRKQKAVTKLYLITFGFSLFIPILLVRFTGLPGGVLGYLIIMSILLVLLVSEFLSIRLGFIKEEPLQAESGDPAAAIHTRRPSEVRAERERLSHHRGEGMSTGYAKTAPSPKHLLKNIPFVSLPAGKEGQESDDRDQSDNSDEPKA